MAKLSDLPRNNGAETEQIIQKLLQRNMDILERARSKQPIRGNGFIMFRNVNQSGTTVGPMLQFRPGETTETARAREVEEQAAYLKRTILIQRLSRLSRMEVLISFVWTVGRCI